jgi:hypothetical protein
MEKIDLKQTLKHLYQPGRKDFELVEVPEMQFLMVDGAGDPNTAQAYQDALQALYTVAYKLKFASKKELDKDYVVPPLEGLWWAAEMDAFTTMLNKDAWSWTMMIMIPEWITLALFREVGDRIAAEKEPPADLGKVRLEGYREGLSAQIMHIGPYAEEGPTLARLYHEWMPANGLGFNGKHHEIYLSDPRRTALEKLKTVLRQPVRRV